MTVQKTMPQLLDTKNLTVLYQQLTFNGINSFLPKFRFEYSPNEIIDAEDVDDALKRNGFELVTQKRTDDDIVNIQYFQPQRQLLVDIDCSYSRASHYEEFPETSDLWVTFVRGMTIFSLSEIEAEELAAFIKQFTLTRRPEKPSTEVVYYQNYITFNPMMGYGLNSMKIKLPDKEILNYTYNSNMFDHLKLIDEYSEHRNKFMIMYHGTPGTGKTYFLRYLSDLFVKKDYTVINIPTSLFNKFGDPQFTSFITDLTQRYKRILFKIEDGEKLLWNRSSEKQTQPENVSTLLNLIDGDSFAGTESNIIVACTFNCDKADIDPALLRAGRLLYSYEFRELTAEKANQLAEYLQIPNRYTEPISVAEVFRAKEFSENEDLIRLMNNIEKQINELA